MWIFPSLGDEISNGNEVLDAISMTDCPLVFPYVFYDKDFLK
jgi:hypothetical protein